MDSIAYGQFSQSIHEHFLDDRVPLQVSLEITRRCPLKCQHCYNNLAMGDLGAAGRELTKQEYYSILDELADMGTLWLLFTGGEIFARKDFLEIYTYAKQKGFLITLFTNGNLINQSVADYLREFPPFAIEITLYGNSKDTYEALTAVPGSYERCIRGIRLLLERGLPLKLKTVVTRINKHEVIAMKEFAEQELGVEFKFDSMINARIDCSHAPLAVRLGPEEVVALDLHWGKVRAEYRELLDHGIATAPPGANTVYTCGGGVKSFAIDPYGVMTICVLSHRQGYDLRTGGVRQGWERFLLDVRRQPRRHMSKCTRCRIRAVCSMCPANGELENGDPESPVDFFCEVAHLRAMALGVAIPEHGECEFCAEGDRRSRLEDCVRKISAAETDPRRWREAKPAFAILNNHSASATCKSCGAAS